MMEFKIFTLFPGMFDGPFQESILKKAQEKGLLSIEVINFRDYATGKHKSVDDTPYGGGQGMVLMPDPIVSALEARLDLDLDGANPDPEQEIVLLSPQGRTFRQEDARRLAETKKKIAFICGHYEGFDERIRSYVTTEYSIGDYVLTGGELPAMVMVDAISRLLPGVIKEEDSFKDDSFFDGLLEYPHYTKPREFRGVVVPEVLLNGHHEQIRKWRLKESLRRTWTRRPDLLEGRVLTKEEKKFLEEVKLEALVQPGMQTGEGDGDGNGEEAKRGGHA